MHIFVQQYKRMEAILSEERKKRGSYFIYSLSSNHDDSSSFSD